jgi:hypothetical protein
LFDIYQNFRMELKKLHRYNHLRINNDFWMAGSNRKLTLGRVIILYRNIERKIYYLVTTMEHMKLIIFIFTILKLTTDVISLN